MKLGTTQNGAFKKHLKKIKIFIILAKCDTTPKCATGDGAKGAWATRSVGGTVFPLAGPEINHMRR